MELQVTFFLLDITSLLFMFPTKGIRCFNKILKKRKNSWAGKPKNQGLGCRVGTYTHAQRFNYLMLQLFPVEATFLCIAPGRTVSFSSGLPEPRPRQRTESSLQFRLKTVPASFFLGPTQVRGACGEGPNTGSRSMTQILRTGWDERVLTRPRTYRRVAASVEVSSPSILYTFPYITYSNWSALQNNSDSYS